MNEKICPLCGKEFHGHGNNPDPIEVEGLVCNNCNETKVIPARLEALFGTRNKAVDSARATWLCKNWPEDAEDRKQLDQKLRQLNLSKKLIGKDANIIGSKSQIEKLMMWMGISKSRFSEIKTVEKAEEVISDVLDVDTKKFANDGLINTREFINEVNNSSRDYVSKTIRFFGGGGVIITLTSLTKLYVTDIDTNETVLFTTLKTHPRNHNDWVWELRDKLLDLDIILGRSNWRKELKFKDSKANDSISSKTKPFKLTVRRRK